MASKLPLIALLVLSFVLLSVDARFGGFRGGGFRGSSGARTGSFGGGGFRGNSGARTNGGSYRPAPQPVYRPQTVYQPRPVAQPQPRPQPVYQPRPVSQPRPVAQPQPVYSPNTNNAGSSSNSKGSGFNVGTHAAAFGAGVIGGHLLTSNSGQSSSQVQHYHHYDQNGGQQAAPVSEGGQPTVILHAPVNVTAEESTTTTTEKPTTTLDTIFSYPGLETLNETEMEHVVEAQKKLTHYDESITARKARNAEEKKVTVVYPLIDSDNEGLLTEKDRAVYVTLEEKKHYAEVKQRYAEMKDELKDMVLEDAYGVDAEYTRKVNEFRASIKAYAKENEVALSN